MNKLAYLDLQDVITSDPLVMHVVIGIIGISTVLVLHKCEPDGGGVSKQRLGGMFRDGGVCLQPARSTTRRRDVATDEPAIAVSYDVSIVKDQTKWIKILSKSAIASPRRGSVAIPDGYR